MKQNKIVYKTKMNLYIVVYMQRMKQVSNNNNRVSLSPYNTFIYIFLLNKCFLERIKTDKQN